MICAFGAAYMDQFWPATKFPLVRSREILTERSAEYYLTTRQQYFSQKIEKWSPEGPERDQQWSIFEKAFTAAKKWYDKTDGKWLMGNTFSYADILAASGLFWFKKWCCTMMSGKD